MHHQHDDPLERELSRLSHYTGTPPEAPLWQRAAEQHRREQQRKLWVWVRRPAPALAAAALTLLVASMALQPSPFPHTARTEERAPGAPAARGPEERLDTAGNTDTFHELALKSERNSRDTSNARYTDPDKLLAAGLDTNKDITGAARGGGGGAAPTVSAPTLDNTPLSDNAPTRGDQPGRADTLAARTGNTAGGAGPRGDTARADNDANLARKQDPALIPPPPAPLATKESGAGRHAPDDKALAVKPEAGEKENAGAERDSDLAQNLANLEAVANIRVAVPDVKAFYYQVVPQFLDTKNGEVITDAQLMLENAKDAADGVNFTLRVNEQNLPQVMEQFRKTANVQAENAQIPPREDRLKQIEALVNEQQSELKTALAEDDKAAAPAAARKDQGKGAPSGANAGAKLRQSDAARKKAEENLAALQRQRERIEKGVDFARVIVQAVPEPATPSAPPAGSAAPLVVAPPPQPAPGAPSNLGTRAYDIKAKTDAAAARGRGDATSGQSAPAVPADAPPTLSKAAATSPSQPAPPPGTTALPADETGKITRAAREGWSTLGDSTADVVRSAIGTMIYWLPPLAAVAVFVVWRRRKAAAEMQEPPPQ